MGESYGNWVMGRDEEMFPLITTGEGTCVPEVGPSAPEVFPLITTGEGTLAIKRKITGTDMDFALGQVKRFLETGQVQTDAGALVSMTAGSICVHGDGDHAVELAAAVRQTVLDADVSVEAVAA